mmetsp:Transcript_11705/g.31966  ORF Transcript_11705/g.31966 Transcript_11705/m.31966 type:complete len:493 (-) Transcript_11705:209-1687(-)|eukprot:CAMPEP_0171196428 /NCGR_PEP_ID=MMETSP0790-20130122/21898_1 /TAXON_ID=2925 /ORGANISM="Alexandrium catenella, Strain OF101" /LENGTH=492 /DNA_ID=CAMNT_0011661653 /DNA_START=53 /DNA_END=1531 /DNA_ORIENTATION=+
MDARNSGGLLACAAPGDHLIEADSNYKCAAVEPPRPARVQNSTFGSDEDLASELPPNWTLRRFQEAVKAASKEYFVSLAVDDTITQVRDLLSACPSEADELGVVAIRSALDHDKSAQAAVIELLKGLYRSEVMERSALTRSFEKLFCTWEDITIDVPNTPEALLGILYGCIKADVLSRELLTKLPENLLKAGLAKAEPDFGAMLEGVATELKEFKKQATVCLEEYYVSLNVSEVETFIKELNMRSYHHEFVKKAITLSFVQTNAESGREAVLALLAQLNTNALLSKDDLQWGVTRLLGQLDDLELDCPHCAELATQFLTCMVADELVSVPFLRRCRLLRIGGATGLRVLEGTQRRTPEYSKKHLGTDQFKREIHTMILEFFNSGDEAEFGRCVRELAPLSRDQSAELVRKVMVLAIERSGSECEMALRLLICLARQEELDTESLVQGFDDMYARMPDLKLDVPDAEDMARTFVVEAKKAKILHQEWPDPIEA